MHDPHRCRPLLFVLFDVQPEGNSNESGCRQNQSTIASSNSPSPPRPRRSAWRPPTRAALDGNAHQGFLPLVQQSEAGTAGAPAASTAAAAAAAVEMAPGESVDIVLGLNLRNEANSTSICTTCMPGSPHYRQFLTPAQFASQYAPTDQQVASVVAHLRKAGFVNIVVAPNRLLVSASGTAATIKSAFRTTLKRFTRNGRSVYANTDAAQVPNAIGGVVGSVLGLQNVELMHKGAGSQPQRHTSNLTIPAGASAVPHNPTEFSSIYGGDGTPTASQTTVGIISEGDLSQTVSDLNTFAANNSLGTISSSIVKTVRQLVHRHRRHRRMEPRQPVDRRAAGGSVKQVVFYVAPSMTLTAITAAYNKAVTDNVAKVINVSLGVCESSANSTGSQATDDTIFKQAVAQGQTFSVSAGDHGAYECASGTPSRSTYTVSEPATSPYVIAVGGTTLFTNTSTNAYNSEIVWNDPSWQPAPCGRRAAGTASTKPRRRGNRRASRDRPSAHCRRRLRRGPAHRRDSRRQRPDVRHAVGRLPQQRRRHEPRRADLHGDLGALAVREQQCTRVSRVELLQVLPEQRGAAATSRPATTAAAPTATRRRPAGTRRRASAA